ncbi:MAG: hypothetical protein ACLKAK_12535 [Alkaliphilus sp.]
MKPKQSLLGLLIICALLVGCYSKIEEKTVQSDELIYFQAEEISLVQIETKQDRMQLEDIKTIGQLVEKLQGIELRRLSVEEEMNFFTDKEIRHIINFISDQDELVGAVFVFTTGEMVFPDVKTMHTEERTVSYINEKEMNEKFESIVSLIEQLE